MPLMNASDDFTLRTSLFGYISAHVNRRCTALEVYALDPPVTVPELYRAGYSAMEVKGAGWPAPEMAAAGYTLRELKAAGFGAPECRASGFEIGEMRAEGFPLAPLLGAGWTLTEARAVGFEIAEAKAAGCTLKEIRVSTTAAGLELLRESLPCPLFPELT